MPQDSARRALRRDPPTPVAPPSVMHQEKQADTERRACQGAEHHHQNWLYEHYTTSRCRALAGARSCEAYSRPTLMEANLCLVRIRYTRLVCTRLDSRSQKRYWTMIADQ
jgi:hypothetical protein